MAPASPDDNACSAAVEDGMAALEPDLCDAWPDGMVVVNKPCQNRGLLYHQYHDVAIYFRVLWGLLCHRSKPSSSHSSSFFDRVQTGSSAPGSGQRKRSFSSRFCHRQKPLRCQYRILILVRRRLVKTNNAS